MEKRYYKIAEVSKLLKVETTTIRYWEKEFGKLHSKRSVGKRPVRLFTGKDLEVLKNIHRLLKVELYTIEGAKRQIERVRIERDNLN